jgi:chromosomal replication initiation ATPase DnaA
MHALSPTLAAFHTEHKAVHRRIDEAAARHAANILAQRKQAQEARAEKLREAQNVNAGWMKRQYQIFSHMIDADVAAEKARLDSVRPRSVEIAKIQSVVADHYRLSRVEMISARRHQRIVFPRQVAMYLAKVLTTRSYPEIGRRLGGRDHTTVMHAVRKIESRVASDAVFAAEVDGLKAALA